MAQNKQYNVNAKTYASIDEMLKGVPFDMMVTLTDMQAHGMLNKKALVAGNMYGVKSQWRIRMPKGKHYWIWQKAKNFVCGEHLQLLTLLSLHL